MNKNSEDSIESVKNHNFISFVNDVSRESVKNDFELQNSEKEKVFVKKHMQRKQSRKLPYFAIYFIMFITGVVNKVEKQSEIKRKKFISLVKLSAIISTMVYVITICTGLIFSVSNIWFLVVDSLNEDTKTTIFSRSISIILSIILFSFGNYSISVLHNLYITKDLQDAIRIKTKSYFKIPASFILVVLIGVFLYSVFSDMELNESECKLIKLNVIICYLKYYLTIIYSTITIFWNYLVALTIMIINRTYTISIRSFLIDLESDSFNIMKISRNIARKNINESSETLNYDYLDSKSENMELHDVDYDDDEENTVRNANMNRKVFADNRDKNIDCSVCINRFSNLKNTTVYTFCEHIKSPNDILVDYWKIANNLKLISNLTQRWMFSIISSILVWCLSCLIGWIGQKNPSLTSVLQFIVPLLVLAVIFGTYAEANAEGNKIIQFIHPLEERIRMLNYLKQTPLQIRMYGFPLDYSAEVTFMSAISIGFLSQIIFHEINP